MKKRRYAHIQQGDSELSLCPACGTGIDAFTAVDLRDTTEKPEITLLGGVTMCYYCGTLLIFTDNAGHLRLMNPEEQASIRLAPELEQLYEKIKKRRQAEAANATQVKPRAN